MIIRQGKKADSPLIYTLAPAFRIVNIFFAAMIALGAFTIGREDPSALLSFPVLLVIILLLTAAYQDRWVFDAGLRQAISLTGIAMFVRRVRMDLDQVERFSLSEFRRGAMGQDPAGDGRAERRGARYVRFAIITQDGVERVIDVSKLRRGDLQRVRQAARTIAGYCGVPLEDSLMEVSEGIPGGLGLLDRRNRWDIR